MVQAKKKLRPATCIEVLNPCHKLACLIVVEIDKTKSTKWTTMSLKDKCCPTNFIEIRISGTKG